MVLNRPYVLSTYTHRLMCLSTLLREASRYTREQLVQRPASGQYGENKAWWNAQLQMRHLNHPCFQQGSRRTAKQTERRKEPIVADLNIFSKKKAIFQRC